MKFKHSNLICSLFRVPTGDCDQTLRPHETNLTIKIYGSRHHLCCKVYCVYSKIWLVH